MAKRTPYKFGAKAQNSYFATLRKFPIKSHAAGLLGLTTQAIDYHRKKDPKFAAKELAALEIGRGKLLARVETPAWLLQKSDPATYTDLNKVEHTADVSVNFPREWLGTDDGD